MIQLHTKKGFTLIEFIISMMLSTILLSAVFAIYNQISKSTQIIETITTDDTKIMILQDRLQKDINGLAPLWFTKEESKTSKDNEKTQPSEQKPSNANPKPNTSHFFYAENKKELFDFFTFTTTNAMQTYGEDNKHFVRVVYQLKPEANKENAFKLMRKEMDKTMTEFDKKAILEKGTFYTIADNIKSCHISYGFIDQPKPKQDQPAAKDQKKEITSDKPAQIKWQNDWEIAKEKTKSDEYRPNSPQFIKIKISFMQKKDSHDKEHELYFFVPIDTTIKIASFAQKHRKEKPKSKDVKQEQGKNKPPAPTPKPTGT